MGRVLGLVAALIILATPASAAVLTYGMIFKNSGGERVGFGEFAYDPDVKQDIYIDTSTGGPCMSYTEECVVGATWSPLLSFFAEIAGVSVGFGAGPPTDFGTDTDLYAEGHFFWHGRYNIGGLRPGSWFVGDIYFGEFQLLMDTLASAGPDRIGAFTASGPFGDAGGTVEFSQIPAPAAPLLFGSGIVAAAFLRRWSRPKR